MSKRKSKISNLIIVLVVLLVLALVVGLLFKFTRIGNVLTDLFDTSFRVEYRGINYKGDNNSIYLRTDEQARFNVKSVDNYKVTIKPNVTAENDFTYTVDGVPYKYSETNLANVFLSEDNAQVGYFTLNEMDDYSIESVLSKLYEGKTVLVYDDIVNPYLLTVTSNGVTITFELFVYIDIVLDSEHVVF